LTLEADGLLDAFDEARWRWWRRLRLRWRGRDGLGDALAAPLQEGAARHAELVSVLVVVAALLADDHRGSRGRYLLR
jgi:hypothetical protein